MNPIKIQRNWWMLLPYSLLPAGCIWAVWTITSTGSRAMQAAYQPLGIYWNWPQIILLDLFFIGAGIGLYAVPLADFLTRFTEEGIIRPDWTGIKLISWRDITDVFMAGPFIEFRSKQLDFRVSCHHFKDPAALIIEIIKRAPNSRL